jgi:hypothetical protein
MAEDNDIDSDGSTIVAQICLRCSGPSFKPHSAFEVDMLCEECDTSVFGLAIQAQQGDVTDTYGVVCKPWSRKVDIETARLLDAVRSLQSSAQVLATVLFECHPSQITYMNARGDVNRDLKFIRELLSRFERDF